MGERYREGQARGGTGEGLMEAVGLRGGGEGGGATPSQMVPGAQGVGGLLQQQGKVPQARGEEERLLGSARSEA